MRIRILLVATLLLAACSGADEGVRTIGSESGSASGSASGASGSASGASGSASGATGSSSSATSESATDGSSSASGSASGAAAGDDVACAPPSVPTDDAVAVTLQEWAVNVPEQVPSGEVTIAAGNVGGEPHELVIVRSDDADSLPVSDGQVQEDELPEGAFIGEIESFPAGDTCTGSFDLPPGDYVFFCNLVEEEEDGTIESHYEEGMRTAVTVG
jgi:hypothetical protein